MKMKFKEQADNLRAEIDKDLKASRESQKPFWQALLLAVIVTSVIYFVLNYDSHTGHTKPEPKTAYLVVAIIIHSIAHLSNLKQARKYRRDSVKRYNESINQIAKSCDYINNLSRWTLSIAEEDLEKD